MSCNYADGLSEYPNKGKLGLPEIPDVPDVLPTKIKLLADWIKSSSHIVVHTGAGCSTTAGIPDFRGPKGVWTLEREGLKPDISVSFDEAIPTATHLLLKELLESRIIHHIVTQNIDGLHLRSGIQRQHISELHGNMFIASCSFCESYIVQPRPLPTVGQKEIGLNCPIRKSGGRLCRGKLRDTLLDWEHNLPELELQTAELHSRLADLSICLGTTLQIVPAGNLPLLSQKTGGKLVIVNLQPTKHDNKADLIIREKIDSVMAAVCQHLNIYAPEYTPEVDPTRLLQRSTDNDKPDIQNWTIPRAILTQLRQLVADKFPTKKKQNLGKRKLDKTEPILSLPIKDEETLPPNNLTLHEASGANQA